jgi:hypothetical protein
MKKRITKPQSFPSFEKLIAAATEICDHCDEVVIVGGLAMQFWGSPRLTADVDLAATEVPTDIDGRLTFGAELSFGGVRTVASNQVPVDVIVRDDEWSDLYEEAIDHAEDVDGAPAPVVSPEYLVAMKMVAGRPKDEQDVRFLVLLDDDAFDMKECEEIVRDFLGAYAVKELRAIVEEAKWRKGKGDE